MGLTEQRGRVLEERSEEEVRRDPTQVQASTQLLRTKFSRELHRNLDLELEGEMEESIKERQDQETTISMGSLIRTQLLEES